jgi:hypothetical protein
MDEAMDEQVEKPRGELATRTLAMPADTNPSGDIFGGWGRLPTRHTCCRKSNDKGT